MHHVSYLGKPSVSGRLPLLSTFYCKINSIKVLKRSEKQEKMNYKCLFWYIDAFINDSGIAKYSFCKAVDIPRPTYYAWREGRVKLSRERAASINEYLGRFGYEAPKLRP